MRPTKAALDLLTQGSLALARVEANGMRMDEKRLQKEKRRLDRGIRLSTKKIHEAGEYKAWRDRFGKDTNLGSPQQLGTVLFDVLGHEAKSFTGNGQAKTDAKTLERLQLPFCKLLTRLAKQKKAKGVLENLESKIVNRFINPTFKLHNVDSYRSAGEDPNPQNLPNRDPEQAAAVRSCFISRFDNGRIVELDFKGAEVAVACFYTKDKNLLHDYLEGDVHRDMASQCFKVPENQVSKGVRYVAKNCFVFPQFYGSWHKLCTRDMWEACEIQSLTVGNKSMREHLASKGIKEQGECNPEQDAIRGTFEHHIKEIEKRFWNERYKTYTSWKKSWWAAYQKNLACRSLTGFVYSGLLTRKQVLNFPIQGSAFHCLLWCLIQLQKELERRGMSSLIIGQIHDSIIADVPDNELEDFLALAQEIMTDWLPREWDWVTVPIGIEVEVAPVGGSWHDKQEYDLKGLAS